MSKIYCKDKLKMYQLINTIENTLYEDNYEGLDWVIDELRDLIVRCEVVHPKKK